MPFRPEPKTMRLPSGAQTGSYLPRRIRRESLPQPARGLDQPHVGVPADHPRERHCAAVGGQPFGAWLAGVGTGKHRNLVPGSIHPSQLALTTVCAEGDRSGQRG